MKSPVFHIQREAYSPDVMPLTELSLGYQLDLQLHLNMQQKIRTNRAVFQWEAW